jgi:hypothetical protein
VESETFDSPLEFGESLGVYRYRTWICRGCDSATLQESATLEQLFNNDTRKVVWTYAYHPKRMTEDLPRKFFADTPLKMHMVYYEIVESFNTESKVLCAIGLRALLEAICVDKGITDKVAWGLKGKLAELEKRQHIPAGIVKKLESFKFMGDGAAHRLEVPDREDLKLAIEVMEGLLSFLYDLKDKAGFLLEQVSKSDES